MKPVPSQNTMKKKMKKKKEKGEKRKGGMVKIVFKLRRNKAIRFRAKTNEIEN